MKSKRPRKLIYVVNQRRSIRGDKVQKAIKHYKRLVLRTKIEGETKWLANAFVQSEARLKKYGIKTETLVS